VPLRDLAGEAFVLYRRADGPGVHDTILGLCRAAGFSPRIVQEAGEAQTIAALVAAGLGVSLVIAPVPPAPGGAVAYRPLAERPQPWELALAWRRDDPSTVLARFLRVAQQA
jgi:DNA-binding transcriptional LysR family regulator